MLARQALWKDRQNRPPEGQGDGMENTWTTSQHSGCCGTLLSLPGIRSDF